MLRRRLPFRPLHQGLQSVMAVIGDNYDPAVSGAGDKASNSKIDAAGASKLTDKIDAARDKQKEGSTVKKGLQSIMAVIGEEYEEPACPFWSQTPVISPAPGASQFQHSKRPRKQHRKIVRTRLRQKRFPTLLPMLTDDEQGIAASHQQVVNEALGGKAGFALRAPESTISDLLTQLKSDISTLERGNTSARDRFNMPAAIDNASSEMQTLLAELQGDISALRTENDSLKTSYNVPTVMAGQGSEISMLLAQLQGDIVGLRQENDTS